MCRFLMISVGADDAWCISSLYTISRYCIHAFYTHVLILYCLCGFIVNKVVVLEQDDLKCQLVRIQLQYVSEYRYAV